MMNPSLSVDEKKAHSGGWNWPLIRVSKWQSHISHLDLQ